MAAKSARATKKPVKPAADPADAPSFDMEDFNVFAIEGFKSRMPVLRERIKPKLIRAGDQLQEPLSKALKEPLFIHVAQHLRRTVNPPEATWVAFSRAARSYKPFVHIRVAVNLKTVRVSVFVEDYADDKLVFADNLSRNASQLSAYFAKHSDIHAFNIETDAGKPMSGDQLTEKVLTEFAARMHRVKGQHAVFGIDMERRYVAKKDGATLMKDVQKAVKRLKPLYDCGFEGYVLK